VDDGTSSLAWLVSALAQARRQGQTKLVGCLETIADDMVFEIEMAARRASLLSKMTQTRWLDTRSASPLYLCSVGRGLTDTEMMTQGERVSRSRSPWFSLGYLLAIAVIVMVIILLILSLA
jgi:hypothetical protein